MKLYDLRCPRCSGSLSVSSEQGIVQCEYCGSTLYIDAHDNIKLNSKKITENLSALFSQVKKDKVANHDAIVHGYYEKTDETVHFKEKPMRYKAKTYEATTPWLRIVCLATRIICCVVFIGLSYNCFDCILDSLIISFFVRLFVGVFLGTLVAYIIRTVVAFHKNAPYRKWEADRNQYIEDSKQQFKKSKFISFISGDAIGFYNTLVAQSKQYNVKSIKVFVSLDPKGCSYKGSVNCPYRERMNNVVTDHWETVYETDVSFEKNNFVFLNIERRDIMYHILVDRFFEETKGNRTGFKTNGDLYTIEIQYDNDTYEEPSLNEIW